MDGGGGLWGFKERIKETQEPALENGRRLDSHARTAVGLGDAGRRGR